MQFGVTFCESLCSWISLLGFLVSFSNLAVEFWHQVNTVKVLCMTTEVTSALQYVTHWRDHRSWFKNCTFTMIFRNRKENLTLMLKIFVQSLYFFSVKATKYVNTPVSFDPFFLATGRDSCARFNLMKWGALDYGTGTTNPCDPC